MILRELKLYSLIDIETNLKGSNKYLSCKWMNSSVLQLKIVGIFHIKSDIEDWCNV